MLRSADVLKQIKNCQKFNYEFSTFSWPKNI